MPSAHCVCTVQGVILAADQGFLDLVCRRELDVIGQSHLELTDLRDRQHSAQALTSLQNGAAPIRLQERYLRPDGSSVAANMLVTCFRDHNRLVATLFWKEGNRRLPPARLWEVALGVRHANDVRKRLFGGDLSPDPIGAILLSIYLAEAEGRTIDLNEIAQTNDIPVSTTSRWIKHLRQRDIVATDRNTYPNIELTRSGLEKMEVMLEAIYNGPASEHVLD